MSYDILRFLSCGHSSHCVAIGWKIPTVEPRGLWSFFMAPNLGEPARSPRGLLEKRDGTFKCACYLCTYVSIFDGYRSKLSSHSALIGLCLLRVSHPCVFSSLWDRYNFIPEVCGMDAFDIGRLPTTELAVFVCSTTGQGEVRASRFPFLVSLGQFLV